MSEKGPKKENSKAIQELVVFFVYWKTVFGVTPNRPIYTIERSEIVRYYFIMEIMSIIPGMVGQKL